MSDIYPIAVPKWGIEMVEGTVNIWNKQEGDSVARGDEVFEMESDKITNVWDSPVDGVLRRIIAREGDAHPVGALLGVITTGEVEDAAIDAFIADFSGDSSDATAAAEPAPAAIASASGPNDAYTRSSPAVRKLADKLGVDLNVVTGTGRRGRITEDDVRAAAGGNDSAGDDVEIIPMSATRKTIARRLTQAKQDIPHYYLGVEWQLDGLLAHRSALNESGGTRVSVNDLLVYCVSRALLAEPRVNINVVGDEIHQFKSANVAVAVATDDGLYPVTLRGVETMSPVDIAEATTAAAARAGSGTLSSEDLSGGSFTVSNLGMFGIDQFTAIINPPMGAILALGAAKQQTVVENGEIKIATVLQATLSCDHRGIDGAVGAAFLLALKQEIDALG
jgi:pyruvate dehydrogenase E2 component (dihydrolipoyllysine-residue acetyltransferase)